MTRAPGDEDDLGDVIPFQPDEDEPESAVRQPSGDSAAPEAPAELEGAAGAGQDAAAEGPGPAERLGHAEGLGPAERLGPAEGLEPAPSGAPEAQQPAAETTPASTAHPVPEPERASAQAASDASAEGEEAGREAEAEPGRRRKKALRKAGVLAAGLLVGVLALGLGAITVIKPYLSPDDFEGPGSGSVTVRIAPGSSAYAIGSALAEAGVVASAESFVRAAEKRAVTDRLRPGHYRLRKGMAAVAALDLLLKPGSRVVRRVTVPEGLRVQEVFDRLSKLAGLPIEELRKVDQALVGLPEYARGLEGFLFPATYEIEPGDTAVDVLAAMVERFAAAARHVGLEEGAKRLKLTPLEVVTVASMIQAEGGTDEDYPKIARVIYNRLAKGTPLEIDSTVLYALNRRTLRVTESDTKVDSPYNTYRHKGLPPGPIANPGEKALLAALNPAEGDWHWFVTTDPAHRITKFTNKESEFVRYREELNKNLGTS